MSALVLLAGACSGGGHAVRDVPSANHDGRIRHLVLHYTSEDTATSLRLLTQPSANPVSAHYLIDRADRGGRATVYRLVDEADRAWHAGQSIWRGETALNGTSIGIEIVNESACEPVLDAARGDAPRPCRFAPFDEGQIKALVSLAGDILRRHPDITPDRVLGHGDIAPARKVDPGPLFPWRRLHAAGIGAWPEAARVREFTRLLDERPLPLTAFQQALAAWGYDVPATGEPDQTTREATRAFQMHFRPAAHDGTPDAQTMAVLLALLARYRPETLPAITGPGIVQPASTPTPGGVDAGRTR